MVINPYFSLYGWPYFQLWRELFLLIFGFKNQLCSAGLMLVARDGGQAASDRDLEMEPVNCNIIVTQL
jgi:hypothetical protein